MKDRDMRLVGRCFGTAVLGPRGQLVIPVEARKELGIDTGDKLLVFGHFGGRGLMLMKIQAVEEFFHMMTSRLDEVAKAVKESKATDVGTKGEDNQS